MVKYFSTLLVVLAFAVPAMAQDVPQVEIALGYANVNVNGYGGRHSGFASHQTINLNSWVGIDNYLGYYGFGTNPTYGKIQLITDIFGGKFTYRGEKVAPYAVAGIGGGFLRFPQSGVGTNNSLAFRLGGGVDIPIGQSLAWKVDVSRVSFHFGPTTAGGSSYASGTNLSTGIVIKLAQ